jgi:hypothetical protein
MGSMAQTRYSAGKFNDADRWSGMKRVSQFNWITA